MNTNNVKQYAPKARTDFITAITKQAAKYGITAKAIAPIEQKGDIALIGDRPFPVSVIKPRAALMQKVEQLGFQQVIDQVAYSWFNRLCAIRFMELKDYLGHGRRVLSHPEQDSGFHILEDCLEVELPGLDHDKVRDLKLDGTKDEELYRELLLAQCHALHRAMPFLFEALDDETELLLPENLTKTDSLIRELVDSIPEEDWQDVEIIGWLYQFYISEKKDQVIGKVVKSEDIPAATQLFTPNWIVKYMVQNSLGAQWLATYSDSPLKAQMDYYIEPAEQTDEVNAQLKAITPNTLNPEQLTLIDPACGSGHILVEAYDLFKAIYLERGYRQRDIAQLILEKNLFGLDIDGRAAQLTGFALMMKARADDRRLFERGVKLNVMAMLDSTGFDAERLAEGVMLADYGLQSSHLTEIKQLFEHASTFGSLIQIPEGLAAKLPALKQLIDANTQDMFLAEELKRLKPLVQQTELLAARYDAVVANPPYMGNGGMNSLIKVFAKKYFPCAKTDLFACFIERGYTLAMDCGRTSMVTMQSWMFLTSFEKMRVRMQKERTISTIVQIGYNSFPSMNSKIAQAAVFSLANNRVAGFSGTFLNLNNAPQAADKNKVFLSRDPSNRFVVSADEFVKIPGSPLAYWASPSIIDSFSTGLAIGNVAKKGLSCSGTELFYRYFWEVSADDLSYQDGQGKWVEISKGGDFRKWFGNTELRINWESNGAAIKRQKGAVVRNEQYYFRSGLSWNDVTSGPFSCRLVKKGVIPTDSGPMIYADEQIPLLALALNSKVANSFMSILCPTIHFGVGQVARFPVIDPPDRKHSSYQELMLAHELDWNAFERSRDFQSLPILIASSEPSSSLESAYISWVAGNRETNAEMKRLEEENNRLFIDVYGLSSELTPDVPIEQITLTVNPAYRYGGKVTEKEQWDRFRKDTMQELVSYAIGCMMGRYSLDEPGLIYAHSGNVGFDASGYPSFPADDDGIIPLTDKEWFADDAANRLIEFMSVAWDSAQLEDNLSFLSDNLSPKKGEGSRDTLRRYLCDKFYKDHMQTYKKRPIYWLFSSGKQKAFQCLVYLHRYNESTLARMRTEYVIPLTAKLSTHVGKLEQDKDASSSTAEIKRLEKEIAQLHKQQAELSTFDEKLRHYADQRISLDLDDGVKVNYGKFGDLLAEVKAIHGK